MAVSIPSVSKEYIHVPVTANVELNTQTVEFCALQGTAVPDGTTAWTAAEWEGGSATSRTARLLIGPGTLLPLAPGSYVIWVRITDTEEIPVRSAGSITIL